MRIIRSTEARLFNGGPSFQSHEYDTHEPDLNVAKVMITGRVPATGTMRNTKVKEIVYVEAGTGTITIGGKTHEIGAGDVIFYEPFEEVAWEGELTLIIACTPAWSLEQHEMLP
ncbi:MAG TPA: cupin domain-containing protein [Candidatus Paceibacterota bacterium]|nr:cupin domain-containing protein [Candidatus Paceibacterota bacterium]